MRYKGIDSVRLKTITKSTLFELGEEIDKLTETGTFEIVDVKFSSAHNEGLRRYTYSALVFYKKREEENT